MSERPAGAGTGGTEVDLSARLADFRALRARIERDVLPLAGSVDGKAFQFQASLQGLELQTGGYVVIEDEQASWFGQVLSLGQQTETVDLSVIGMDTTMRVRGAAGRGVVLEGEARAFHDARVRPATADEVHAWVERSRPPRATLQIGELLLAPGVPAELDAGGFNRHTFMCGQSGSGKTYSLGLVLERLLVGTSLRMVILDPNSDYVRIAQGRDGVDPAVAATYAAAASDVSIWGAADTADHQLGVLFAELMPAVRAATLGLDPVHDREEYAALNDVLDVAGKTSLAAGVDALRVSTDPAARRLGMRAANIGALDWSIWTRGQHRSLIAELDEPTSRCLVVDLGSLDTPAEQHVVATAVLTTLWRQRTRREPTLIVIDEAHNVCPRNASDPVTAVASDYAARIAAEGRKFGLYLLTSTQRPQKVNEEVLTQSDNLMLMRMNSEADLGYLHEVFSFVPPGLIERSSSFGLGETLIAGKFFPNPGYVRFGARQSQEGGSDIPTSWANLP